MIPRPLVTLLLYYFVTCLPSRHGSPHLPAMPHLRPFTPLTAQKPRRVSNPGRAHMRLLRPFPYSASQPRYYRA